MNILFWNTCKNKGNHINDCLVELISEKDCDILVLAEYEGCIDALCKTANIVSDKTYSMLPIAAGCEKISGLINSQYRVTPIPGQTRYQILKIETTFFTMLVATIHNLDKKSYKDADRNHIMARFHASILEAEEKCNTKNTLIIGDFNANPFEESCISAYALHAIPFVDSVKKLSRKVQNEECEKFYNPTWKLMGKKEAPYATYYYDSSGEAVNYYWHMLDQVVIRPQLIDAFDEEALSIMERTKSHTLVRSKANTKIPDKENYSDHLPIYCKLKEARIR